MPKLNLVNSGFSQAEYLITRFPWIAYGFNNGHFFSTLSSCGLPFDIILGADPDSQGRALLHKFGHCQTVLTTIYELLAYIKSPLEFTVTVYVMYSPRTMAHTSHTVFWRLQLSIIEECRRRQGLHILFLHIHPASPKRLTTSFGKGLRDEGWLLTSLEAKFPEFGDSIDSSASFILGVHSSTQRSPSKLKIQLPPPITPSPMSTFLVKDFNKAPWVVSWSKDSPLFIGDSNLFHAIEATQVVE